MLVLLPSLHSNNYNCTTFEKGNSNLPQAYMDACDAAILLIDARNCASLLSAHQIQRNMKTAQHAHVQCEMLMNTPTDDSGQARVLQSNALETSTKRAVREICVKQMDRRLVEEMLLGLCERVSTARKPALPSPQSTTSSV
uniref:Mediator of RNA polymerase II transcription subunit 25 n=1 Tax=Caenorhabditis tropicalis TaxID=1561998 RepID=A0A1I7UXE1_9PELO